MLAFSHHATEIVGTLENVSGRANVTFERDSEGRLAWEYDGTGTTMFWDGMITVERDGKTVFLDERGDEWTEDQVTLVDDDVTTESILVRAATHYDAAREGVAGRPAWTDLDLTDPYDMGMRNTAIGLALAELAK